MAKFRDNNGKGSKSRDSASTTSGNSFTTRFVDLSLSEADKAAFEEWQTSQPPLLTLLSEIADEGVKVSIGWNEKTQSFISSATNQRSTHPNYQCCYTSFAPSFEKALWLLVYKFDLYCAGREQWTVRLAVKDEWG